MFKGIHLTLLIGSSIPKPAPFEITNAITSVEVRNNDNGRDGFQITLKMGRGGNNSLISSSVMQKLLEDYNLSNNQLLQPFNRVILIVTFGFTPKVLFDGVITNVQSVASSKPGTSNLVITGEDLSVMMDLKRTFPTHGNQSDSQIARKIIGVYAEYGLVPVVKQPISTDHQTTDRHVPSQSGTDLEYLKELAERNDFIFYLEPTDIPGVTNAYWVPRELASHAQKPLTTNMGPETNVSSISFQYDALKPIVVTGSTQVPFTNTQIPIRVETSSRSPLSTNSPKTLNQNKVREREFQTSGLTYSEAMNLAQSEVNESMDAVIATGEIDVTRYGDILRARKTVWVRGVGLKNDGLYYVRSVTHYLKPSGFYKQTFELVREGTGTNSLRIY